MSRILRLGSIGSQEERQSVSSPQLNVEFEVGRTLTLRPALVVRGSVSLVISEKSRTLFASSIKIKFRGEETASAKIKDSGPVPRTAKRIETARTIYFECNYTVWSGGNNGQTRANEYCAWKELAPGVYKFEFALKLPPVNFPPSVEGPKGFSIRYVWQPVIEGAGGSLIEGPEVVTPFIPISFAPPDREWSFRDILYNESRTPRKMLVEVEAILPRHVFSPGEELKFILRLTNHSSGRITCVQCSLRKHYEGPLDREFVCEKHERSLVSTDRRCDIAATNQRGELEFSLVIPKKFHHVPPTFVGRHLRVYYTLRCVIQAEMGTILTKMQYHEVIIPIAISSFPHLSQEDAPVNISYPSYTESRLGPFFFDPKEDFPPLQIDTLNQPPYSPSMSAISSLHLNNFYSSDHDSSTTQSPYYSENDSSILNDNVLEVNHRVVVTDSMARDRTERTTFTTTRLG